MNPNIAALLAMLQGQQQPQGSPQQPLPMSPLLDPKFADRFNPAVDAINQGLFDPQGQNGVAPDGTMMSKMMVK